MGFSSGESVQEIISKRSMYLSTARFDKITLHGWLTTRADSIMILFQGQAMDLFWTYNGNVPSKEEYYRMIDQSEYIFTHVVDDSF